VIALTPLLDIAAGALLQAREPGLERLAGLGIAHVHGRVNEMETITPLEIIGERVIPVAASF